MKPCMDILVGPIASGKSAYFSTWSGRNNAVIVNSDSLVKSLHGGDYSLYKSSLKPLYAATEIAIINQCSALKLDIVIEMSSLKSSTRRKYATLGQLLGFNVRCLIFPIIPPEVSASRMMERDIKGLSKEHWIKLATEQISEYSIPTLEEGFDSIHSMDSHDSPTTCLPLPDKDGRPSGKFAVIDEDDEKYSTLVGNMLADLTRGYSVKCWHCNSESVVYYTERRIDGDSWLKCKNCGLTGPNRKGLRAAIKAFTP